MKILYKNNLPFTDGLEKSLDSLYDRVESKKAAMIIIDGGIGEGKTTLLIHLLDYFNKKKGLPPADLKESQYAMGGIDFLKKLRICFEKKLPCIGYDEAGDFSKRGSLSRFNSMLNRTFETFRAFKCIVIVTLPSFDVLDNQLLDKNIPRLLLHLKNRKATYGSYYGYSLYRIQLLRWRMSKFKIKNYAYSTVTPNIYGHFKDLSAERSKELDKISTESKLKILRTSEVKIEGLISYIEISNKLSRPVPFIYKIINQLNIKPTRIIGRVSYFDENVINAVVDKIESIPIGHPKK